MSDDASRCPVTGARADGEGSAAGAPPPVGADGGNDDGSCPVPFHDTLGRVAAAVRGFLGGDTGRRASADGGAVVGRGGTGTGTGTGGDGPIADRVADAALPETPVGVSDPDPTVEHLDRPLRVEYHTEYDGIAEDVPPRRPQIPEWFKQADAVENEHTDLIGGDSPRGHRTIKACPSFHHVMADGHVVPFWCDMEVEIREDGSVEARTPDEQFHVSYHTKATLSNFTGELIEGGYAPVSVKVDCPWKVKTDAGVGVRLYNVPFNYSAPFMVTEGIVYTAYYEEMLINSFWKLPDELPHTYHVEKGDPFFAMVPFVRREAEADVRVNDEEFWTEFRSKFPHQRSRYRTSVEYRELDPFEES